MVIKTKIICQQRMKGTQRGESLLPASLLIWHHTITALKIPQMIRRQAKESKGSMVAFQGRRF